MKSLAAKLLSPIACFEMARSPYVASGVSLLAGKVRGLAVVAAYIVAGDYTVLMGTGFVILPTTSHCPIADTRNPDSPGNNAECHQTTRLTFMPELGNNVGTITAECPHKP